ncbi:MAG: choice-of-anchor Q domain-containing protein [Pirellulales bacterium]
MFNPALLPQVLSQAEIAFSTIAFNRAYAEIDQNVPDDDEGEPRPQRPEPAGVVGSTSRLSIYQTIVGANESVVVERGPGTTERSYVPVVGFMDLAYNVLVGQEAAQWLDSLAFNGRQTQTHALLPGSPAIDAGDPAFDGGAYDPPITRDQRGQPRVVDGDLDTVARIDIGSYEYSPTFLFGDLNGDGVVGLGDLMAVQRNFAATDASYAQGDLNADGRVDSADVGTLVQHLGSRLPPIASPSASAAVVVRRTTPGFAAGRSVDNAVDNARRIDREVRRRGLSADSVDRALQANSLETTPQPAASKLRVRRRVALFGK